MAFAYETDVVTERIGYRHLPYKGRLAVLMLARIAEPLVMTSIQSCVFFQLRRFDPSASDATIVNQAGLLVSLKTAAHVCTGMLWGRLSDSEYGGRKLVLVIGLLASAIGMIGYGFSQSFASAIAWQLFDGVFNSSISMIRCMTAELYPEKRYRTRAMTLLPLGASVGMFSGPIIGGFLASGLSNSAAALNTFSFAMPSLVIAGYCIITALIAATVLEEGNLGEKKHKKSFWAYLPRVRSRCICRAQLSRESCNADANCSEPLLAGDSAVKSPTLIDSTATDISSEEPAKTLEPNVLLIRRIWTSNVIYTMLATFLTAGHLGTFTTLWPLFLSAPMQPPEEPDAYWRFSGGLGMDTRQVAVCMSMLGSVGVLLQIIIYPTLSDIFGTIRIWRFALFLFPVAYSIMPFATLAIHSPSEPSTAPSSEAVMWVTVAFVLLLFIAGRTGVTPATSLLINDCTPHRKVRGTIHATGTIVSNLGRTIFPVIVLPVFGYGLTLGISGLGFWCLAILAVLACAIKNRVVEGNNGDEIVRGRSLTE